MGENGFLAKGLVDVPRHHVVPEEGGQVGQVEEYRNHLGRKLLDVEKSD